MVNIYFFSNNVDKDGIGYIFRKRSVVPFFLKWSQTVQEFQAAGEPPQEQIVKSVKSVGQIPPLAVRHQSDVFLKHGTLQILTGDISLHTVDFDHRSAPR